MSEVKATVAPTATMKAGKKPRCRPLNVLGKFFGTLRLNEDISTTEWAKLVGRSQQSISAIERGEVKISVQQVEELAKAVAKFPSYVPAFIQLVAEHTGVILLGVLPSKVAQEVIAVATGQVALAEAKELAE